MANESVADAMPERSVCDRCGCEYDQIEHLKAMFDEGVDIVDDGHVYCKDCMKDVSEKALEKRKRRAESDMSEVLDRINDGKTNQLHEQLCSDIVDALNNADYRKNEYTYDLGVLSLSMLMLAETELEKLTFAINHQTGEEEKGFSVLVGRYLELKNRLSALLTDFNDLNSDFAIYSINHSSIHRLDDPD